MSTGLIVSLIFLVAQMYCAPYGTPSLNTTQSTAVLANVLTLFVGLMTIIDTDMETAAINAGETYDTSRRSVIAVVIVIVNLAVIGLPFILNLPFSDFYSKLLVYLSKNKFSTDVGVDKDHVLMDEKSTHSLHLSSSLSLQSSPLHLDSSIAEHGPVPAISSSLVFVKQNHEFEPLPTISSNLTVRQDPASMDEPLPAISSNLIVRQDPASMDLSWKSGASVSLKNEDDGSGRKTLWA